MTAARPADEPDMGFSPGNDGSIGDAKSGGDGVVDGKRGLRRQMRELRRAIPDRQQRSLRIWDRLYVLDAYRQASTVMAFHSIVGEPDTAPFIERCALDGKTVVFPEDEPSPDPARVDLVVVPGLAFTQAGERLGQGGGWYDRFLAELRPGTATVGVAFAAQIVPILPTEPHDVRLTHLVTDA